MPKCQFLIWQKFCFSLCSNYSIWILKFKEAERNRRQEQDVLKSPFPPHIDTWISFGKLSVFQCCCWNWNIGVLLFPCCCSPVGMYFFWESSVPTPECWMQSPHPPEGGFFVDSHFSSFLRVLGHFTDWVFRSNGSCCSVQVLEYPADLGDCITEFQGPLYSEAAVRAAHNNSRTGRAVKAAESCCT